MVKTNIPIWGEQIPGNSPKSKLADMDIGPKRPDVWLMLKAAFSMPGKDVTDAGKAKKTLDTYQYYHEIATGFRPETYEDMPCIDYYPCSGADTAVLVIPGGGYTYQSNSGVEPEKQYEGGAMAVKLNQAGFAAFVLSRYRLAPYRMPIPLLDAQRAVRYIRYHAREFQIDADMLGIMGFSAGAFQTAGTVNILRNASVNEILAQAGMTDAAYCPDAVDAVEAKCAFAGLIYPMLSFRNFIPAMTICFPREDVVDTSRRNQVLRRYEAADFLRKGDIPQYVVTGTKDKAVDSVDVKDTYVAALEQIGIPHKYVSLTGATHGFGATNKKYSFWIEGYTDWIRQITCK